MCAPIFKCVWFKMEADTEMDRNCKDVVRRRGADLGGKWIVCFLKFLRRGRTFSTWESQVITCAHLWDKVKDEKIDFHTNFNRKREKLVSNLFSTNRKNQRVKTIPSERHQEAHKIEIDEPFYYKNGHALYGGGGGLKKTLGSGVPSIGVMGAHNGLGKCGSGSKELPASGSVSRLVS